MLWFLKWALFIFGHELNKHPSCIHFYLKHFYHLYFIDSFAFSTHTEEGNELQCKALVFFGSVLPENTLTWTGVAGNQPCDQWETALHSQPQPHVLKIYVVSYKVIKLSLHVGSGTLLCQPPSGFITVSNTCSCPRPSLLCPCHPVWTWHYLQDITLLHSCAWTGQYVTGRHTVKFIAHYCIYWLFILFVYMCFVCLVSMCLCFQCCCSTVNFSFGD